MKVKKVFFLTILLLLISKVNGQHIASTFHDIKKQGVDFECLDSIYNGLIFLDSTGHTFPRDTSEFLKYNAYKIMLQDIADYLVSNKFEWDHPIKIINKIYYSHDGTIDYFLYRFNNSTDSTKEFSIDKQIEFNRLLTLFIQTYKFPIKSEAKFSQCGTTTYMPKIKNAIKN